MWYNWRAPSYNIQIFEPRLVRNRYVQLKERQLWAIAVETVRVFPTIGKTKKAFVIIPYSFFLTNSFYYYVADGCRTLNVPHTVHQVGRFHCLHHLSRFFILKCRGCMVLSRFLERFCIEKITCDQDLS